MFEEKLFEPGEIIFNGFDEEILENFDPDSDLLTEDMLQVKYSNNLTLDVGWYIGLDRFIIYIVKDSDWERPIEKRLCKDVESLRLNLSECLENIKRLVDINL
jgi:hypothetical protein